MSTPDFSNLVSTRLQELLQLTQKKLPIKVGAKVRNSIRQNFRQGSFYGSEPWQQPLRRTAFGGQPYKTLTSDRNHLMMSVDYIPSPGRVTLRTTVPYASIHNEGGQIKVTKKMKGYFWAKYHEAGGYQKKGMTPEAAFWRNMALKRVGSKITIPKRQFMGEHPEVDRIINDVINKELLEFANKFTNNGRSTI